MHDPDTIPAAVQEEQHLLEVVHRVARTQRDVSGPSEDYDETLLRLRDEMIEERLAEDRASVLEQMERVAYLRAQRAKYTATTLDESNPYFGHMRLVDDADGTHRDILIGKQTWVKEGVRIVDWRHAPISMVFYQRTTGEDFEIPIAGRMMEGEVKLRRLVTIRDGALRRVTTTEQTWVDEGGDEGWVDHSARAPRLAGGAGSAVRPDSLVPVLGSDRDELRADKHLPEIASLLDPEQFALITRPDSGVVAIQGSAGSGKTTVALHRVAYLAFNEPRRFDGQRTLIVVFSSALARYISRVLPALGVPNALVRTWDNWSRAMRRAHFPKVPDRYSDETPSTVIRFKLHSALLAMLVDGWGENPLLTPQQLWEELFTNRGWIGRMRQHDPEAFSENQLNEVHRWCSESHFVRVDGEGHREDDVPEIDREDDALLLHIHQLLKGRLTHNRRPLQYGHLVVDEAQDLSPLELQVLRHCVAKNGAITLAGDVAQRLEEDKDFQDWAYVLGKLGLDHVQLSPLAVTYRSTAEIMRLAHHILGPLAGEQPESARGDGRPPQLLRFKTRGEAVTFASDAIRGLVESEPLASVAVLARYAWQADEAHRILERSDLVSLQRIEDHEFCFEPGVEVAEIRQTKGLEFDYVILMDVDADTFPPTDASRHMLHVGVTRAAHQVWCLCVGTPSPLLPDWLPTTTL
ncbi:MAG: DNA helicase-2/ATP-dependent DNA helicase PcrA [Myxococcota bacterium]|jgi:DNA helicase-2/ATP-dependent DNA helicase PcrA